MTRRRAYMKETGQWVPAVWCSPHDMHPDDCWDLHNPGASRPAGDTGSDWSRWLRQAWDLIERGAWDGTETAGAGSSAQSERDSMDTADGDSPGHGDQVAR